MPGYGLRAAALALLFAAAPAAAEVTARNFAGGRTADLAALCGAGPADPLQPTALAFCHGFLVGTGQYHHTITAGGGSHRPIFCLPDPQPTLDAARAAFVTWFASHPQHAEEQAVDGAMRFAAETYPCPRPAARAKR